MIALPCRRGEADAGRILALLCWFGLAGAQQEPPPELPAAVTPEKAKFENALRRGLTQVLQQYEASLDGIAKRQFRAENESGVVVVKQERDKINRHLTLVETAEPLELIRSKFGRLHRGEVELRSHLMESTWKLNDGREMKLRENSVVLFNGKRDRSAGWIVASGDRFLFGGAYWVAEVRDHRRRFTAKSWRRPPRQTLQGVLVDSVEYIGSPDALMARESGRIKVQLGTGVKTLLQEYSVALLAARDAALKASDLASANRIQQEWERIYLATDILFGDDCKLGEPPDTLRPKYDSPEALRAALLGSTWQVSGGFRMQLEPRGKAILTGEKDRSRAWGWEVLDHQWLIWGGGYKRVRLNAAGDSFSGWSSVDRHPTLGTLEKRSRKP